MNESVLPLPLVESYSIVNERVGQKKKKKKKKKKRNFFSGKKKI